MQENLPFSRALTRERSAGYRVSAGTRTLGLIKHREFLAQRTAVPVPDALSLGLHPGMVRGTGDGRPGKAPIRAAQGGPGKAGPHAA